MSKTIEAVFKENSTKAYTGSVWQYDHRVSLHISGILLPEKFEVHFSNSRDRSIASAVKGENYTVRIPDVYLVEGEYVWCWIYVNKVSVYQIVIPVERRPRIYEMDDGDDEAEKTFGFTMGDEETLQIETVDPETSPDDPIPQESGWYMDGDETISFRP